jgi:hypothetical protein
MAARRALNFTSKEFRKEFRKEFFARNFARNFTSKRFSEPIGPRVIVPSI